MNYIDNLVFQVYYEIVAHKHQENSMEKEITLAEFAKELKVRLENGKTVDCCKQELLLLADIITEKIGSEKIRVTWQD